MEQMPLDTIPAGNRTDHEVLSRRIMSTDVPAVTAAIRLGHPGRRIVECLESVRLQTAAGMDLIVIEQGSRDESVEVTLRWMAAHWPRFRRCELLRLPAGRGMAAARNLAFRIARTPHVLVLDDDDVVYPRCVAALEGAIDRSGASLAYCCIEASGARRGMLNWRPWEPEALKDGCPIEPMALIRKAEWERVGGYDEDAGRDHGDFYRSLADSGGWGILVPEFLARQGLRSSRIDGPDAGPAPGRFERPLEGGQTPADGAARSARDDREIRGLRADLDLLEWHSPERHGRQLAASQGPRECPTVQPATDPDLLVLAKARRLRDRLMPAGTRRFSAALVRAARILAAEGPRPLFRRASRRLARSLVSATPRPFVAPDRIPSPPARPDSISIVSAPSSVVHDRAPPRPHVTPSRGPSRFALLSSSLGNCYFHQIRDLIACGLAELGHDVVRRSEEEGFRDDVDWQVVVAPHEFFFLGQGESLRRSRWPDNVIIVSTEQPSTTWFAMARECLDRAHAVWDIDHNTSRRLRELGIAADHLPLGYAPSFADYGRVAELPLHYGTSFLDEEVRRSPAAGGPLHGRPLDLLFVGGNTPRREAFFARAAPALADHRAYIHIFDSLRPSLVGRTTYMDTATVVGLSQRSKVLLNVHHGTDVYFEWQRIVLQGLWQRTLVVSERCSLAPPFRAGIDYVEADLDRIPAVLRYYLDDPRGRIEAQEIADAGHETLVYGCRLSRFLEPLLTRHASTGAVLDHFDPGRSREAPSRRAGV
jgi:Glycosyl transferase family 2